MKKLIAAVVLATIATGAQAATLSDAICEMGGLFVEATANMRYKHKWPKARSLEFAQTMKHTNGMQKQLHLDAVEFVYMEPRNAKPALVVAKYLDMCLEYMADGRSK